MNKGTPSFEELRLSGVGSGRINAQEAVHYLQKTEQYLLN